MNPRPALLALVTAPLALALVACGGDSDDDGAAPAASTSDSSAATSPSPAPSPAPSSAPSSSVPSTASGTTGDDALLAAARTGRGAVDGTVFTVDRDNGGWDVTVVASDGTDLDLDDRRAVWEVQLGEDTADEQTVVIDAATGDVVRVERDD